MDPSQAQKRHVSSLNEEQLYRKRALDRENQRVLRLKKKTQLEELEKALQSLQGRLEQSEREKAELEERETKVRGTLQTVLPLLQQLQAEDRRYSHVTPTSINTLPPPVGVDFEPQDATIWNAQNAIASANSDLSKFMDCSNPDMDNSVLMGSTIRMADLDDFTFTLSALTSVSSPTTLQESNHALSTTPVSSLLPQVLHLNRIEANTTRTSRPVWSITPDFTPPIGNVDHLVLSLINAVAEHNSSTTAHSQEFTATSFPSIMSLLNPADPASSVSHPVSSTIAKHIARVVTVSTLPEKLALLYILCLLVRWQICPTQPHYEALPPHFRPRGLQLAVPHPFWVGTIAWPGARDNIIQHMDYTQYDLFAKTINKSFSVNWDHGPATILQSGDDGGFVLSRGFVDHIRDLKNWTVGRELVDTFPFLEGMVNLRRL